MQHLPEIVQVTDGEIQRRRRLFAGTSLMVFTFFRSELLAFSWNKAGACGIR